MCARWHSPFSARGGSSSYAPLFGIPIVSSLSYDDLHEPSLTDLEYDCSLGDKMGIVYLFIFVSANGSILDKTSPLGLRGNNPGFYQSLNEYFAVPQFH